MNRLGPMGANKWQIPLNPVSLSLSAFPPIKHHSGNVIKHNFVDLLPSKCHLTKPGQEGRAARELQVASVPLSRGVTGHHFAQRATSRVLWQPVITPRRDALSCRFQPDANGHKWAPTVEKLITPFYLLYTPFPFFKVEGWHWAETWWTCWIQSSLWCQRELL